MSEEIIETTETEEVIETGAQVETTETDPVDSDKVVEKLQSRLKAETAQKKDAETQLAEALERIKELETNPKKTIKEKSDEDKVIEKDKEIQTLRNQIRASEITKQADEVLKEAGLSVPHEMLSILVNTDEEKTFSNIKSFVDFVGGIRTDVENDIKNKVKNSQYPSFASGKKQTGSREKILAIKDDAERLKAIADNKDLFPEL
ncbi:DUF4355 domain-containing protein [Vagococcus carniphilus]|uniref:capsid assembly scaffolding protein Gp46 family protein n=1 Tax=Vagococcus carniphilus TaxID=218144 RepID=UPI00288ED3AF|nr:DUF4355 domain-containing protein [Vagococcus carniphilus]MDT2830027.1 DUF4355 domain-containing protein [Vagococcus carniphilus]MDT2838462.1 DUF4355 domain-containing protein [Vagococcus carniphilus]MDT2855623.1 DUF4355 domain-containing protein [Vagococcus carniphilus]